MRHTAILGSLLLLAQCGLFPDVSREIPTSAVVLFRVGSLALDGTDLKPGAIAHSGQEIRTGEQSMADLQYRDSETALTVRLYENSVFKVGERSHKNIKSFRGAVAKGRALFRAETLAPGESYTAVTPVAVASVRGTLWTLFVKEDLETAAAVYQGKVALRRRLSGIEDLPEEVQDASDELKAIVKELEKKEIVLEPMMTGIAQKVDESPVQREIERIRDEVKIHVPQSGSVSKWTAGRAAAAIRSNRKEDIEKVIRFAASLPGPVRAEAAPPDDLKTRMEEYTEIVALARTELAQEKNAEESVRKRSETLRAQLQKRIETIFNKASETVVLVDGRRVRGVVLLEGTTYTVLTVEGAQTFTTAQVDSVEF